MISTIFFDFDGVLTTNFNATETICRNVCEAVPELAFDTVMDAYRTHFRYLLIEPGTHADKWDDFCSSIGQKISLDLLRRALRTVPKNDAMFALAHSLQKKYRLGIITDNSAERMELLEEDLRLSDPFDPVIVSASVHASKHDGTTAIFDVALDAAQCKSEESIFIDNQERNLVIPQKMGMKTYWHDDGKNSLSELRNALQLWGVNAGEAQSVPNS